MAIELRLALALGNVPDSDGLVVSTTSEHVGVRGQKCDAPHPAIVMSQVTNTLMHNQGQKKQQHLPTRVPGVEGRQACASRYVPDFDGLVPAAAGDKLAVGRKRDRFNAVL